MSKDRESSPASGESNAAGHDPGISNRESANEERAERAEHPPVDTSAPSPEDAAGRVGEQPVDGHDDLQTSQKAGSRSMAQKEADSRYPNRAMPASKKVAGASGKEPKDSPSKTEQE